MRYDSIIVGTGPAGLEAALNLKIRNKNFLIIGNDNLSHKIGKAPKILNYLGLPRISGAELSANFQKHLSDMEIEITPDRVTMVYNAGDYFSVSTTTEIFQSKTIILATGIFTAKAYDGEEEFLGRGVGYCATCDAPLYRDKKVVIVGFSQEAVEEANFVSEIAKEVLYLPVGPAPTALNSSIKLLAGKVQSIQGGLKAEKLVLDSGEIIADGIFILRESIAPANLLPGLEVVGAHIKTDENMSTNLSGCFAAGDCTGTPYQYMRAAGQGLVAAHSVVKYLIKNESE